MWGHKPFSSTTKIQIDYWKPGKLHLCKIHDHRIASAFDEYTGAKVSTIWWTDK